MEDKASQTIHHQPSTINHQPSTGIGYITIVTAHISLARFPQTPLQPSKAVEKIPEIAILPAKYEQLLTIQAIVDTINQ